MSLIPIFDGHNDLLARLYIAGGVKAAGQFSKGRPRGHLDAAKAEVGGFAGGFFAVWVPSVERGKRAQANAADAMTAAQYDVPLPPMVPQAEALKAARIQIQTLKALEAEGALRICTTVKALEETLAAGTIAAILHMEGAEAIDRDLETLDMFHAAGLRSLGPVWSRPTVFAEGVPFRFPGLPDVGGGLTEDGKRLVARCNTLKIMIDLSHLNEAGFWDTANLSDAPLVATHSNAHALCPHARNLTDRQLDAIAGSGGVVGLNFATAFLRSDGRMDSDTPLETMLAQLDYMIERMGEDHVALGSDFDGAVVPKAIGDVSGLPALTAAMEAYGYGTALIEKICHRNWMRVLRATWDSSSL